MSLWRFADHLPAVAEHARLSLGEGNTPLVRSRNIGPSLGLERLFFKIESSNPTGSYKDRFAASAVSHLVAEDAPLCIGTSSGNAGAALAAYCAPAGIRCVLAIVESAPRGKLCQMLAYGAELFPIRGFGTDAKKTRQVMADLEQLAADNHTCVQISAFKYSPKGMAGVETISRELCEQLVDGIDHVFCPTSGGGLTWAVARGFESALITPAIHCVQPSGNNTIAGPLREGAAQARSCDCTTTISGLQVANVIDGHNALGACRASGGTGYLVEDNLVYAMQQRLAREEGIFCEPAGAVALAGAVEAVRIGELASNATVVCLVTGSGFKDNASVERMTADLLRPPVESVEELAQVVNESRCIE